MSLGLAAGLSIGLLAAPMAAGAQQPQAAKPPARSAPVAPEMPADGTVIKPPTNIDPGIKARPPTTKIFPMPVIKPRVPPVPPKPDR